MEKVTLRILNKFGRSKGDFIVSEQGTLFPVTKSPTIWGQIPTVTVLQKNICANHALCFNPFKADGTLPENASVLFKFQKNNYGIFSEYIGQKLACHFDTPTTFNFPAKIDVNEPSIQTALKELRPSVIRNMGTVVVSMLQENDCLYSFSYIGRDNSSIPDVRFALRGIDNFIKSNLQQTANDEFLSKKAQELKEDYCYQYLFRDCFGDIDFTSKNGGIIHNKITNEVKLAANFDYGEMFSYLYSAKFVKPIPVNLSAFPENLQNNPAFVESMQRSYNQKLEVYNTPAYQLGLNHQTFGEDSLSNISTLCEKFPNVVLNFLTNLRSFIKTDTISAVATDANHVEDEQFLTDEEQCFVEDYVRGKTANYEKTLVTSLTRFASRDFVAENKNEIMGTQEEIEDSEQ